MPRHLLPGPFLAMAVAFSIGSTALAAPPTARSNKPTALVDPPSARADSPTRRSTESLARRALAAYKDESANAIAELRSIGPAGLRAFLEANRREIEAALNTPDDSSAGDSRDRLRSPQNNQVLAALDSICQQKDCHASRLYWYTDLEQAKSAARTQGKSILSLRLLGRLDEDLSCANSRLFRIMLYANEQVSTLLRERFVLHWQSVRPVPRVTIDFGDGRTMERTLTGNSIHYVLDSEGRLIDALPGVYGPGEFLRELARVSSVAARLAALRADEERNAALHRYHETRLNELEKAWLDDVKRAGLRAAPSREIPKPAGAGSNPPSAQTAAAAAISKSVMVERPVLRGMSGNPMLLDSIGNDAGWSMIAGLHAEDATLDQATRKLMLFKDPSLTGASLHASVAALERAVAEDTVRNEYVFRARVLGWLASGDVSSEVASLNEKIYAELFLTPSWDTWLGLRPAGAYSAIDNDGVRR
ncbi:MAG TPA: hypothetical protein VI837_11885 [Blastocatellia bacterium]|nr:hypothetical protein [Blastocatellia bacterium]